MTQSALYAIFFLLTMLAQTGAVASLPDPYRVFPLALVLGVIVLHERSLLLGALWIATAGILLEARGLGNGYAFASIVAALAACGLALGVFAKRSFFAMLGIGVGTGVVFVTARIVWLLFVTLFSDASINLGNVLQQSLWVIVMMFVGVCIFGAYIRRFLRWSRKKFVSKGNDYAVSFPQ